LFKMALSTFWPLEEDANVHQIKLLTQPK
jgi:hypothetical protein